MFKCRKKKKKLKAQNAETDEAILAVLKVSLRDKAKVAPSRR